MYQVVQHNVSSVEETAVTSEKLSTQTQSLMEQVEVLLLQVGCRSGKVLYDNPEESFKRTSSVWQEDKPKLEEYDEIGRKNILNKTDLEKVFHWVKIEF